MSNRVVVVVVVMVMDLYRKGGGRLDRAGRGGTGFEI